MDSELKELTSCCSCGKLLKKPKILPCLHSYCTPCLPEKIIQKDETIKCLKCKESYAVGGKEGSSGTQKDILAESLIYMGRTGDKSDELPCSSCDNGREAAVDRCVDCGEFLCSECSTIHRKLRQTRDHELIALNDPSETELQEEVVHRKIYCELHSSEELRYLCEQAKCKQSSCRE